MPLNDLLPVKVTQVETSRRRALVSVAGAAATLLMGIGCGRRVAAQSNVFTPEMFGAKGDGRSDDYPALQRLAAAVTAAGGGVVQFGRRRHYLIDQIDIWGGPNRKELAPILFDSCRALRIDLNGSTVHVKGDFHRSGDTRNGRFSWLDAVIPLSFHRCVDLVVENGELNGHADRMTRDESVDERHGHGIAINGCSKVLLEGLHIHHFSVDGVRLGILSNQENDPCRDIRLNQVRLTNNGRQGLTIAGAVGVVATDSEFSESGRTGGSYRHAPSAGVDLEPNRRVAMRSDFRAIRCRFNDSRGAAVVAVSPDRTSLVELIDCSGRAEKQARLILKAERALIRGGTWHNIQIACAVAARHPFQHRMTIDVSEGLWAGDDPEWVPVHDTNPNQPSVRIHRNRFRLISQQPFVGEDLFNVVNKNHRFEENDIFVSGRGHDGSGDDVIGSFLGAKLVRGNRWATDLTPPRRFVNDYSSAQNVEGESFSGSFGQSS